jgi:hypothetical protein
VKHQANNKTNKKIKLIISVIACMIVIGCITIMTVWSWNVKTVRITGGVSIKPAFVSTELTLAESDYIYIYSGEDFRPITPADAINNGDRVYVKMTLHNKSNIATFCRFEVVDDEAKNVEAEYKFYVGDTPGYSTEENSRYRDHNGWYYYANSLNPNETYNVWLAIHIIEKTGSNIVVGTPYVDMIQARGEAVSEEEGWKEIEEFFVLHTEEQDENT